MIRDVFRFLGEEIEDANFNPSRRGAGKIRLAYFQTSNPKPSLFPRLTKHDLA
jgi:hypothetical protein